MFQLVSVIAARWASQWHSLSSSSTSWTALRAVARRTARPERRFETGVGRRLLPHPPAHEAPGLAGKVRKCGLEGLEPADDPRRVDHAISGFGRAGSGAGCWPGRRPYGHQFIVGVEHVDARAWPLGRSPAREHDAGLRIEKLEGGTCKFRALPWFYGPRLPRTGHCRASPQRPVPQRR